MNSAVTGLLASIPSPSTNGFSIGPIFFHAYGIMYVLAVAAAIFISRWRWAKIGGDPDLAFEVAIWAFPGGLIGGRIYFDITTPSQIPDTGGACSRSGTVGSGSGAGSSAGCWSACGSCTGA